MLKSTSIWLSKSANGIIVEAMDNFFSLRYMSGIFSSKKNLKIRYKRGPCAIVHHNVLALYMADPSIILIPSSDKGEISEHRDRRSPRAHPGASLKPKQSKKKHNR